MSDKTFKTHLSENKVDTITVSKKRKLESLGIEPQSKSGQLVEQLLEKISSASEVSYALQKHIVDALESFERSEVQSLFNVKKMISFEMAKLLHDLHPTFRSLSSKLVDSGTQSVDLANIAANVPALFSSSPVVAKTATYTFASTEVAAEAFKGNEPTHHIYSRLMNPTSIILALKMVELEAGQYSGQYMAYNFNSGMAAIEAILSNILKYNDILIVSRHVYGGVYQLLVDYFAHPKRLNCKIEWFDGESATEFYDFLNTVKHNYREDIEAGSQVHVYLESPCNPHGKLLDVAGICEVSHASDLLVILDSTVATPALYRPLSHSRKEKRPDFVVHSYTKDISGHGNVIGGVVIGETHRMFVPKGHQQNGVNWNETLFWDVYYIKGGFLSSEGCSEVLNGLKTLELRMLKKAINTTVLTSYLASNRFIRVNSPLISTDEQKKILSEHFRCAMPAPLFSFDLELVNISATAFSAFLDSLEPLFSQMVSLGQINTIALCPALTSHSEMDELALQQAGITATTIRLSVGCNSPYELATHFRYVSASFIDPLCEGFSEAFMSDDELKQLILDTTIAVHQRVLLEQ